MENFINYDLISEWMSGWTGFAIVAGGIGLFFYALIGLFGRRPAPQETFGQSADVSEDLARLKDILRPKPLEGRDEEQIGPELLQAGFYRPAALPIYLVVRTFLIAAPVCICGFLALSAPDRETSVRLAIIGVVLAVLGFSVPRIIIGTMAKRRRSQIERGLPVALDLITLGLLAGQNVQSAFRKVSGEIRRAYPVLSDEMNLTLKQADLNTFPHALEQWGARSGVNEVQNLSVVLSQADRLGTDSSNALLELAQTFRTSLRQRADAQANRAGFWMLFPTVFCMWIPAAMVLAMPLYFQFQEQRRQATEAMRPDNGDSRPISEQFRNVMEGRAPTQDATPPQREPR
jgi:hypothetical protein